MFGRTFSQLAYVSAVAGHLIVAIYLYYGGYGGDADSKTWDLPQLAGAFTLWLHTENLSSKFWTSHWFLRQDGHDLTHDHDHQLSLCHMVAITLPTLSVIFSGIGIGTVFLWDITLSTDRFHLASLYSLNVFFILVLSWTMGLWSGSRGRIPAWTNSSKFLQK